ncbi:MAG: restriction endonuclease [Proteobacteria bacterium]|nr:restriction endonuclease [Pseudomonadota bacterium]
MARSGVGILMAVARDVARYERQAAAAHVRSIREAEKQARMAQRDAERATRERARTLREQEREEKARHLQDQEQEVADLNTEIANQLDALAAILPQTLSVCDAIAFDSLRIHEPSPVLEIPEHLRNGTQAPDERAFLDGVLPLRGWRKLIPGARKRYERACDAAKEAFEAALSKWQIAEAERSAKIATLEKEHAVIVSGVEAKKRQRNAEVDEFEANYKAKDPDAIVAYYTMVFERSSYPDGLPHNFSVAFTAASQQLVVEYELPTALIVPRITEHRYVRSSDTISGKQRKDSDIKDIYQDVIASIALRTMHEAFEADQIGAVQTLCFNGYVNTIDPATGRDIRPHLISVRTTAEKFRELDLSRVDKQVCLKNLGAQVSRRPDEAQPVKPIVEFQMADARFIDQQDLVSGLSSAANLMDLNPYEFEQLVANLFGKMGLESKLTRSSRDGGVDCVAYDARPVLGGKVVIQAKRYRHTVGVSAVRDLYGTMMNEGANKGILVTTSGYGPDAFDFSKDKPIELIDGGGLLYLLQENGIHARIVFPDEN